MVVQPLRTVVTAALLLAGAGTAHADDNEREESRSCPFPHHESNGDGGDRREREARHESCPGSASEPDFGESSAVYGGSTSDRGCGPGGCAGISWRWARSLSLRVGATFGSLDWGDASFTDRAGNIDVRGEDLAIGRMRLVGGEVMVEVEPVRFLRIGAGFAGAGATGGADGGYLGTGAFGPHTVTNEVHVLAAVLEASILHRYRRLTLFAGLHTSLIAARVHVQATCGCAGELRSFRGVFGPQGGLRVRLYRSLYAQAAVMTDVLSFPDYVATLGIDIGGRR